MAGERRVAGESAAFGGGTSGAGGGHGPRFAPIQDQGIGREPGGRRAGDKATASDTDLTLMDTTKQPPVQQTYQHCVSDFKNSTLGKVVSFGSLLSFIDDFKGTAKNWAVVMTTKGAYLKVMELGGQSAAGPANITPLKTVFKIAGRLGTAGVAAATFAHAASRWGCYEAANPDLFQYTNRFIW
jgi:hypothetical protein